MVYINRLPLSRTRRKDLMIDPNVFAFGDRESVPPLPGTSMYRAISKIMNVFRAAPVRQEHGFETAVIIKSLKRSAAEIPIRPQLVVKLDDHSLEAVGEFFRIRGEDAKWMIDFRAEVEADDGFGGAGVGEVAIGVGELGGVAFVDGVFEVRIGEEVEGDGDGPSEARKEDEEGREEDVESGDEEGESGLQEAADEEPGA